MPKPLRLGDMLVEKGLATTEQIDEAIRVQVGGNRRLGYILIKMKVLSGDQLLEILSDQIKVPIIEIAEEFSQEVKNILPRYLCNRYTVMPIAKTGNNILSLAMVDPSDETAIADIEKYTGMVVKPLLAREKDISSGIFKFIPFSTKDVLNPEVFGILSKVAMVFAILLLCAVGAVSYSYIQAEKYGDISVVADSKTFKNHDLMLGVEESGKITLLGHGAYSKGFYSVTFDSPEGLHNLLKNKRNNFSDKQYDWLMWVVNNNSEFRKNR